MNPLVISSDSEGTVMISDSEGTVMMSDSEGTVMMSEQLLVIPKTLHFTGSAQKTMSESSDCCIPYCKYI